MENNPYSAVVAYYVPTMSDSVMNYIRDLRKIAIARGAAIAGSIAIAGLVALVSASSGCASICQNFASPSHERSLNDSREGRGLSYICADTKSSEPTRYSR